MLMLALRRVGNRAPRLVFVGTQLALVQRVCNRLQAPRHYSGNPCAYQYQVLDLKRNIVYFPCPVSMHSAAQYMATMSFKNMYRSSRGSCDRGSISG